MNETENDRTEQVRSGVLNDIDPVGVSLWVTFMLAMWLDQPWLLAAWLLGLVASDFGRMRS